LQAVQRSGLLAAMGDRVRAGMPYLGVSAGANLACPTIRTTNDMPIVQPASLAALGLIQFQVNPHYPAAHDGSLREARDRRLGEFLEENDVPRARPVRGIMAAGVRYPGHAGRHGRRPGLRPRAGRPPATSGPATTSPPSSAPALATTHRHASPPSSPAQNNHSGAVDATSAGRLIPRKQVLLISHGRAT
jgi:hypothetical protein